MKLAILKKVASEEFVLISINKRKSSTFKIFKTETLISKTFEVINDSIKEGDAIDIEYEVEEVLYD